MSSNKRSPNGYIVFYKFYKKMLVKDYPNLSPQERMAKAGELWRSLPNELKNSFIEYANDYRILNSIQPTSSVIPELLLEKKKDLGLVMIFDDLSSNSKKQKLLKKSKI
ncbi:hypothetical protein RhiirA1_499852 [Rhizophagus irregularis]|uniref:HMG box domain-containing protein n=1 Tax=Rhizophagus irregularis TaxID=588596 RepID=A0A2N0R0J9_9GLOM|nr:hypothetical protein RhiirA1_499852 [Rhizophagus irregularis]